MCLGRPGSARFRFSAKTDKLKCRIYGVGIGYSGRTHTEGKEINWKDGVRALWCILSYHRMKNH